MTSEIGNLDDAIYAGKNSDWYAVPERGQWVVYNGDGHYLTIATERPTPARLMDMQFAYNIGFQHGRSFGTGEARAMMLKALGLSTEPAADPA